MEIISLKVNEFLNYVCHNPTTYDEICSYIYRETHLDELGYEMFDTQVSMWKDAVIEEEICKPDCPFFPFEEDDIFESIKQKSKLFSTNFDIVNHILSQGIDESKKYTPKHFCLSEDDRNRVSTLLDYAEPLINGLPVMDGNDYAGEILDSDKMERGATLIQSLYEEYKDFQFDVKVLKHLQYYSHRLSVFEHLFDLYNNRARYIIELMAYIPDNQPKEADSNKKIRYKSFADIFTQKDWNEYLKPLTKCNPPLLAFEEKDKAYRFIGNEKTEKGCIAQYFKQLKVRGIIVSNINRGELAEVLSNCLLNFKISGASIDNESGRYKKIYEKQLFN